MIVTAPGYEEERAKAAISGIGFAGARAEFRLAFERISDPQIPRTRPLLGVEFCGDHSGISGGAGHGVIAGKGSQHQARDVIVLAS
jgi:hypothetical protein